MVSLATGVARRWVGFVPAGLLGLASLFGAHVDGAVILAVSIAGLLWAVLMTYHELRQGQTRAAVFGLLSIDGPSAWAQMDPTTAEFAADVGVRIRNGGPTALTYRVTRIRAEFGGTVGVEWRPQPATILIAPGATLEYRYPRLAGVYASPEGRVACDVTYGPAVGEPVARTWRDFGFRAHLNTTAISPTPVVTMSYVWVVAEKDELLG